MEGSKGDGIDGGKARGEDAGSDEQNKVGERRAGVGVLEERTRDCIHVPSVL